ncbi:hypothetical protein [Teredinibacter haidensis]|uniref:hypothetical protein n=1 Tax=Teredinibacter haidensis TaxID=2731755 RepID=UPI0011153985|nr:hypothetical protein [Teredinibacter haidensis]
MMNFPEFIVGPTFSEGDILSFVFDDADVTLRIPKIHHNDRTIDSVIAQKDFRNADMQDWVSFGDEGRCDLTLVTQDWKYEDDITHDNIAYVFFEVSVLKHGKAETESSYSLNASSFQQRFIREIHDENPDIKTDPRPYWPTQENNFFFKPIAREILDGFQLKADVVEGSDNPATIGFFSLGREYTLRLNLRLMSLHYPDRKNPYSNELLRTVEEDLFEDLLSHVQVDYNAETLALIEKLR